jgi:prolyl-tRNA synthetase
MVARKFRDEKRPRAGLLRGREFLMKDMYSFDADETTALQTYNEVRGAYDWFFNKIGVPFVTVGAGGGNIGGSLCHEYHYVSDGALKRKGADCSGRRHFISMFIL